MDKIPAEVEEDEVSRKHWKSEMIKKCKQFTGKTQMHDLYAGHSFFTAEKLTKMCEDWNKNFQGRTLVPRAIKIKLKKSQRLTPEEYRVAYRPTAIQHQQMHVMHHIFGTEPFQLKEIKRLGEWMADEEKEEQFLQSRVNKDLQSRKDLSNVTIATYARATLQMLEYIDGRDTDREVQDGLKVAFPAVCNVECNAQKMACCIVQK